MPQPKAERTAVWKEPRILEERLESSVKSLLLCLHLRGEGDGFRSQVSRGGGSKPVVVIEVEVVRQCYPMTGHYGCDLMLNIAEKGNVADRGWPGGR